MEDFDCYHVSPPPIKSFKVKLKIIDPELDMDNQPQKNTSLFQLFYEAAEMLLDRSKEERDLIYFVANLDDEERAAIKFAYQNIHPKNDTTE